MEFQDHKNRSPSSEKFAVGEGYMAPQILRKDFRSLIYCDGWHQVPHSEPQSLSPSLWQLRSWPEGFFWSETFCLPQQLEVLGNQGPFSCSPYQWLIIVDGQVVRTLTAGRSRFNPWQGNENPTPVRHGQRSNHNSSGRRRCLSLVWSKFPFTGSCAFRGIWYSWHSFICSNILDPWTTQVWTLRV